MANNKSEGVYVYNLPRNDEEGTKIYCEASDGSTFINFHHLDGTYSYCTTEKGGVAHLKATTLLEKVKGGYKIKE
jgi:hypothetical protein